jgi:hypothetical protein
MVKASIEIKAIDFPRSPNPTACHNKNSRRKSDTTTRDAPFDPDWQESHVGDAVNETIKMCNNTKALQVRK